jgi:hypothetical protein
MQSVEIPAEFGESKRSLTSSQPSQILSDRSGQNLNPVMLSGELTECNDFS